MKTGGVCGNNSLLQVSLVSQFYPPSYSDTQLGLELNLCSSELLNQCLNWINFSTSSINYLCMTQISPHIGRVKIKLAGFRLSDLPFGKMIDRSAVCTAIGGWEPGTPLE